MWYPVNGGISPKLHFPRYNGDEALTVQATASPEHLSSWSEDSLQLSVQAAASLGFGMVTVEEKGSHKVLVVQAIRYADCASSTEGITLRYGAGVELKVDAWTDDGKVEATLPMVAAQVTLNLASSSASLRARGFSDAGLAALSGDLPALASMDVDHYADLMKALDKCRAKILQMSATDLQPVLFAFDGPPPLQPEHSHQWPRILRHHD